MADNILDLMETVHQHFLTLYQQSSDDSADTEVFLAFEPIGRSIDLDSYKLNPEDDAFFPAKATEELTELTDDIPIINADVFYRTDKSVEETYGSFILQGATAGTPDQGEIDLFNHRKAASKQTFEDTKLGKFSQTGIQYRPAYAKPQDWYDPSQTGNWTTYSYNMSSEQSSSSGKPPKRPQKPSGPRRFWKIKDRPDVQRWQWQVLPQDLTPVLTQPQVIKKVSLSPTVVNEAVKAGLNQKISAELAKPQRTNPKAVGRLRRSARARSRPTQTVSPLATQKISSAVLSEVTAHQLKQAPKANAVTQVVSPAILNNIQQQIAHPALSAQAEIKLSSAVQASTMAVLLDSTHAQSVKSETLKISFQYCLVNVDRPWFSHTLLQMKGWYVPGYEAGELSTGTLDNDGLFPALPISFIVIKDLTISGWSQSEHEEVKKSVSLGPFSLVDRKIEGTSLTWSGLQVIGWVLQVMPMMPPLSDPVPG
ncbi:MAG: hypothetical protein AAF050_19845 [Cyanobacteria bacterium J06649_5]